MNATAAERDFVSIGQLAAHLQQPVRAIERAAERLGIVPAMRLNLVAHFDANQVQQLTAELRQAGSNTPLGGEARG